MKGWHEPYWRDLRRLPPLGLQAGSRMRDVLSAGYCCLPAYKHHSVCLLQAGVAGSLQGSIRWEMLPPVYTSHLNAASGSAGSILC